MEDIKPKTQAVKPIKFSALGLGQLKTLKSGEVTITLTTDASQLESILKLITVCQAGNSLALSAKIVKPKVKKDAKEKPDSQNQKGPRRVRRYPYR